MKKYIKLASALVCALAVSGTTFAADAAAEAFNSGSSVVTLNGVKYTKVVTPQAALGALDTKAQLMKSSATITRADGLKLLKTDAAFSNAAFGNATVFDVALKLMGHSNVIHCKNISGTYKDNFGTRKFYATVPKYDRDKEICAIQLLQYTPKY